MIKMRFGANKKLNRAMVTALLSLAILTGCGKPEIRLFNTREETEWAERLYAEALERSSEEKYRTREFGINSPEINVKKSEKAIIDYSNSSKGYVTVKWTGESKKIKVRISKDDDACMYTLHADEWATLPLSRGSGEYNITVLENVAGSKYAMILAEVIQVEMEDENNVFRIPNLFVDYEQMPVTRALADLINECSEDEMSKAENALKFVTLFLSYDKELAASVKEDYVPELDTVLEKRKGICFDYASLMTALLRCMDVPCKLVTGYVGEVYHAWLSIWSEDVGWIDGIIYFDGNGWQRADPTVADAESSQSTITEYIGDASNYVEIHCY